jgi:hypothetical protein
MPKEALLKMKIKTYKSAMGSKTALLIENKDKFKRRLS